MSSYIAWFEQSDDSDVESFIEEEEAWARQYMYNKDNKACDESNGEQSFEGEHKFQDQDSSEYAQVGGEEEENEQSLEIKNKNDQKKKKKKKKKKKTKAVNTDQDGQKINIQYVDVENDEFFLRMKHEEMERVREHMEMTRARAKDLNQIDFCASFLQCFKMSFTKESKLSTNRHHANELEDESSNLMMPLGKKSSSSKRTAPIVLKRHSQTMCYYGNQLFMFGGTNEHFRFSDLTAYDMDTKTWRNIRVEEIHTGKPLNVRPPTSFMFSMSNHLVLYTSGNSFFIMERALERSLDKYPDEISYRHYNCTHNSASIDTTAVVVKDYSAATVGTKLYTFGGTVDGFSTQILQIFSFTTSRTGQLVVEKFPSFYTSSYGRPPPRSKHGCAVIGTDLYIFGGYCERKNVNYHHTKKLMYNDMFVYRTSSDTWKEVDVKGVSPPPMYGFSMTAIHHFIYVYGGFTEDEEIQSDIYRFDTKNLSWSVILVRGVSFPSTSSPTDYQVPCAQHTAVEINGNRIAIVGGVYDSETQKKVVHPNNFLIINEASDEGTGKQLIDYLWSCVEKDHYSDLHLRCADRQTGEAVYLTVHRAMLAARSPYFAKLLQEFETVEFTEEGVAIMEITDYYSDTVLSFVRFLYKAELKVSGAQQVLDILKCSEDWGHFDTLAAICNGGSRYLDLSAKVMTDLTNDFKRLFLDSIEEFDWESIPDLFMFDVLPNKSSDGLKKYTDACVQLLNDDNEVSLKLTGHKLFLCRAQHIFNAFNSGMEETLTSNIQFNGLSREGLMGVLKFLYTDEIDVNPEIAIEVLLASHMFNLPILSSYCCKVIMENVDKGNVLQILDIADTYHNAELRRRCLTFFMKHHAELRKDDAFSFLSDDLKRVVDMDLIPQTLKLEMRRKRRDMLRYKNRVNKK